MAETPGFVQLLLPFEARALSFRAAPPAAKSMLRTVFYPPALFIPLSDRLDNFEECAGEEPEDAEMEGETRG